MAAASPSHDCSKRFPSPSSLKDLLDFFAKLENGTTTLANGLTIQVLDEIAKRLTGEGQDDYEGWIPDGSPGASDFSQKGNDQSGSNGNAFMPDAIKGLKELRSKILQQESNYGSYGNYTFPGEINSGTNASEFNCIKKYADAILSNAFPLFGCLFYLYFMCSTGGSSIGGGKWQNGSELKDFLTDASGTDRSILTLTRGYNGDNDLKNSTKGNELFPKDQGKLLISKDDTKGQLQQALYFLLFLAPRWHPAMSGHALLFLDWFSKNASTVFSGVKWLNVKIGDGKFFEKNCNGNGLEQAIKGLGTGNGNGANISPVYTNTTGTDGKGNLYSPQNNSGSAKTILHNDESFKNNNDKNGHRKAHVFMQYVSWLWWCIPHLTESLKEMSEDSENWNEKGANFKNSTTFGPFAFGFTFTDNKWQNGNGQSQLQTKLNTLIQAIEQFKCCFEAFFWAIRRPFAYGSLAAWILSLTFLLYVHFMPLDLFHIQSHYNVFSFSKSPIRPLHEVSYFSRV